MLNSGENKKMRALILLLLLIVGCLEQPQKVSLDKVTDILTNPTSYKGKTVNLNATVTRASTSQGGILYKLQDSTGEITGLYTGSIQLVDAGYSAIFSGEVVEDLSLVGAHTSGVFLLITGIKDVTTGKIEGVLSSTEIPIFDTPTIDEIKKNLDSYSQQDSVYVRGKIIQSQNAGGYTYVELDDGTGRMWVAIPESEVTIGEEVAGEGFLMLDFPSKTLAKTFDVVLFSSALQIAPSITQMEINVSKAEGGYRIEEIYSKKDSLNSTSVKVRGIAVKVSSGGMSMIWIRLQDGSGSESERTNEIMVIYEGHQEIKAGDDIIVTGTLSLNRDFGVGYIFDAVIEDADIQKV